VSVKLLKSPFENAFRDVIRQARREIVCLSPYINSAGVSLLLNAVENAKTKRINILTNLSSQNIVDNVTQPAALLKVYESFAETTVSSLAKLHAKVYIVDEICAVITSANLTYGGLKSNFEYGVLIDDKTAIKTIKRDVLDYASLGHAFDQIFLMKIYEESKKIEQGQENQGRQRKDSELRLLLEQQQKIGALLINHYNNDDSRHRIFTKTIKFLLQKYGQLTTKELYALVQDLHPEMCDDTVRHITNKGRDYGIKWRHHVRQVQVSLKASGIIASQGQPRNHIWTLTKK